MVKLFRVGYASLRDILILLSPLCVCVCVCVMYTEVEKSPTLRSSSSAHSLGNGIVYEDDFVSSRSSSQSASKRTANDIRWAGFSQFSVYGLGHTQSALLIFTVVYVVDKGCDLRHILIYIHFVQ